MDDPPGEYDLMETPLKIVYHPWMRLPKQNQSTPFAPIRTPILTLRAFRVTDMEALRLLLSDAEARTPFESGGRHLSADRLARKLIRESTVPQRDRDAVRLSLAIVPRRGRRPIGGARFACDASGEADVGLWLSPAHQGLGLGREALQALIAMGFCLPTCRRISGTCNTGNMVSRRVMEACGMRLQCHLLAEDAQGRQVKRVTCAIARPGQKKDLFPPFSPV
jgi:RimJ/RimL family protein N-acetyltransferase